MTTHPEVVMLQDRAVHLLRLPAERGRHREMALIGDLKVLGVSEGPNGPVLLVDGACHTLHGDPIRSSLIELTVVESSERRISTPGQEYAGTYKGADGRLLHAFVQVCR